MEDLRTGNHILQGSQATTSGESIARIQELRGRQERISEQLTKANRALFDAKEARDTLLLAMYAIDYNIQLLEEGQMPLFGDGYPDD